MTSKDYVEDEFRSFTITLSEYDEYSLDRLIEVFETIISEAEANGFTDVKLKFESTMDPYEDCLASPQVLAVGLRKKTDEEKNKEKEQKKISKIAKKLGVPYYEASILERHKDKLKELINE